MSSLPLQISAKLGTGVDNVLEAIVERLPPPVADRSTKLRALLFDSSFDKYRGALSLIYIKDGQLTVGQAIQSYHTKKEYEVKTLSLLRPDELPVNKLLVSNLRLSYHVFIINAF